MLVPGENAKTRTVRKGLFFCHQTTDLPKLKVIRAINRNAQLDPYSLSKYGESGSEKERLYTPDSLEN